MLLDRRVIAFVFARGGSTGVPGKNLRQAGGISLLARAIGVAQGVPSVDEVVVSSEDDLILREALECGAATIRRPPELASDTAPEWEAWRHAVTTSMDDGRLALDDLFLSVPPTAPLREPSDVERCLEEFAGASSFDLAVTVAPAREHPSFTLVRVLDGGELNRLDEPGSAVRRQELEALHAIVPVAYATTPRFVLNGAGVYAGRVLAVPVSQARALDVDTELDLRIADLLLTYGLGGAAS